ncbi:NAD-dependent DNA ligase LigA [Patescibacteria group bacterium]
MTKQEAEVRITKLRGEINHHRYAYHVLDNPEISDAALDSLKHELQKLEEKYPDLITPDSPTQRVGGEALGAFTKVRHAIPMLSLNDVFSQEEVQQWETRIRKITPADAQLSYFGELKMDGLAVTLKYEKGLFIQAATRGDGKVGEDVTQNCKTIEAIPLKLESKTTDRALVQMFEKSLKGSIEVRGEIYMSKEIFDELNRKQKKVNEQPFANPRNAAAGSVRQLDSKITAKRKLSFMAYDFVTDVGQKTHEESHKLLNALGFKAGTHNQRLPDITAIETYHKQIGKIREKLPFMTDGIVITVNLISLFKHLGVVGKAPRGSIAYKYPAEQATTVVEDIQVQVGRTGALTPVAHLRPVQVAGSTVSRATLHNMDEIERLDVRVGDTVIIQKAGDIIPDIVNVLVKMRTGKEKRFHMPKRCPVCNSAAVQQIGEVAHYCSNKHCYAQQHEGLRHFISKKAFDIDGLGPKILEQLARSDLVKNPADLFDLQESDLAPLERFAEKAADNLVQAIQGSKTITLPRFIYALGIRHVGEETAVVLAERFGNLQKLTEASYEELENIHDIGGVVAKSIHAYFQDSHNTELIQKLVDRGVKIRSADRSKKISKAIDGKKIVVTGSLHSMSREEVKERIREAGAKWVSSVSKNTDFVVAGEDPGSKYDKAKKLGVQVIDEKEFIKLLNK